MSSQASVVYDRPEGPGARTRPFEPLGAATRMPLGRLLKRLIRVGPLTVALPSGETLHAGDGTAAEGVRIQLRDNRTAWRIALYPGLGLGEALSKRVGAVPLTRDCIHGAAA